jgi:hypothetical protein
MEKLVVKPIEDQELTASPASGMKADGGRARRPYVLARSVQVDTDLDIAEHQNVQHHR